jgi:hypothetical protein
MAGLFSAIGTGKPVAHRSRVSQEFARATRRIASFHILIPIDLRSCQCRL